MALAQDMDRPRVFLAQAVATVVLNKQQRSADNGWSSSHEFRGKQKSYFKRNSILWFFAQGHDAGRLFDTGLVGLEWNQQQQHKLIIIIIIIIITLVILVSRPWRMVLNDAINLAIASKQVNWHYYFIANVANIINLTMAVNSLSNRFLEFTDHSAKPVRKSPQCSKQFSRNTEIVCRMPLNRTMKLPACIILST